jgi:ornithine decarboxylase
MILDEAARFLSRYSTPFFLFDRNRIKENYHRMAGAFPGAFIRYAMKANNHPVILTLLKELGSGFEVASQAEVTTLNSINVPCEDMIFSAPIKLDQHIRNAHYRGVDLFVFDCDDELIKLAKSAPGSRVLVRVAVPNSGSLFPLNTKFGCSPEQALYLLQKAQALGLIPYGITFHVGSQCERKRTWGEAMGVTAGIWRQAGNRGINLSALDIGGGFPVLYDHDVTPIEEIAQVVWSSFHAEFPLGVKLIIEPGRYLVGNAAVLVSSVIATAERGEEEWLYLDASALHGLFEALQLQGRFPYAVKAERDGASKRKYVLSGPTCDPDDTILREVWLPQVEVGDRLCIMNTGAYSFVYATRFHNLPVPGIYFTATQRIDERGYDDAGIREETRIY